MFNCNITGCQIPYCELEHNGEVITVQPQTILMLKPEGAPDGAAGLRLFCNPGQHNKALWCFETEELHIPERVEGGYRLTFLRSLVFALVQAAEGLEITGPGEGAPGLEPVASYTSAVNRLVCVPPFSDAEVEEIAGRYHRDAVELAAEVAYADQL